MATVADFDRVTGVRGSAPAALPHWPRRRVVGIGRTLLQQALLFPALRAVCRLEVRGRSALDDLDGPVILAATHASHLDTLTVLAALPGRLRRRTAVAAAADYFFRRRALGIGVGLAVNAFPFARAGAVRASLRTCHDLLAGGWSVLLYPEGTRATNGQVGPFRPGVGLLAIEAGVPVVPVRLQGLERVLPKGSHRPRPGAARVVFGAPLRFDPGTAAAEATHAIEAAVRAL
jgi:1-acyl-sn-glycerol-3-phosphate acyltransferase